ncbi:MAG: tRNA pseudouridine(38-40) synthase TruA [Deltaproteobacteria bacterium]|nr:tRNA pseudouridine(38-40) synthase TruA [Deltaproteobacteria bacterium]
MKNILFKIEYEGTHYKGWQIQPNVVTVEETMKKVLRRICQCEIRLKSSSRTDAGVHARGQVATVQIPEHVPLKKLFFSVNALLPHDISVIDIVQVDAGFNARMNNHGKQYTYQIISSPVSKALHYHYCHWVKAPLDIELIRQACCCFEGTHDFVAFRGKGCQQTRTEKRIRQITVVSDRRSDYSTLRIRFVGNGFLKNMVRIIVGSVIDIGRGRLDIGMIERAFSTGKREEAGLTAPAKGLTLDKVFFDPDPFVKSERESWL